MKLTNEHHSFTGMQRDMAHSKQPSSFLYDAHNIRLTARGEDTLLTITNEIGPEYTDISIQGTYLGHCLLRDFLVVFSTKSSNEAITNIEETGEARYIKSLQNYTETDSSDSNVKPKLSLPTLPLPWNPPSIEKEELPSYKGPDFITRINLSNGDINILYEGNLRFSTSYPIKAIASYENSNIQKVYWTDGLNQPRVINIAGNILEGVDSQFDFVRELALNEKVKIQKQLGSTGSFAPGVIQYALTYYTKYGQESNIFYTSPLLYIAHKDRGGNPEDKVENAFRIVVKDLDKNFDYLRIYSIQRTSINGTPIVKRIQDVSTKSIKTKTADKSYDISQETPLISKNDGYDGYIEASRTEYSYFEQKELAGSKYTTPWYGYLKSDYPKLIIQSQNGYISWGEGSKDSSVLWVSGTQFLKEGEDYSGFVICETPNKDSTDLEEFQFATKEIIQDGIAFLDTGMTGEIIDPTELLYKGGESIIANTIEQKDNTLFLGNLKLERPYLSDNTKKSITGGTKIEQDSRELHSSVEIGDGYKYFNQLTAFSDKTLSNSVPCGGFKRGDYYRCGVQFQYKNGKWSDPIWIEDVEIQNKPNSTDDSITIPALKGILNDTISKELFNLGYVKARALVVFPEMQDRVVLCQGAICPTLYTQAHRDDGDLYAQSSWFFRPIYGNNVQGIDANGTVAPATPKAITAEDGTPKYFIEYTKTEESYKDEEGKRTYYLKGDPSNLRQVEIQGKFEDEDKFQIDNKFLTLHSPDVEFDDTLSIMNYVNTCYRKVGYASFEKTFSDIDIQTETPTISIYGDGFQHKSFIKDGPYGIVSGLFYDDYAVDDSDDTFKAFPKQKSSYKWLVYPWNKSGSLNNDINRPNDKGVRTASLKKKVISNLRYTETTLENLEEETKLKNNPQVFNSDQLSIIKIGSHVYQGNIDTLLSPDYLEGMYFGFGNKIDPLFSAITPFATSYWWRTFNFGDEDDAKNYNGLWYWDGSNNKWTISNNSIGNINPLLTKQKENVRIKYKSSPHIVLQIDAPISTNVENNQSITPILEIVRKGDTEGSFHRSTMFGGTSEDALKSNLWIPCGEPVLLGQSYTGETTNDGSTVIQYSYGDTYFQRWDCLKTYSFTPEDINQVVEIGSFMLETRVNIDGRYDRNRGQVNNLNMTPQNFNLINPVYTQINNLFSYRILDNAYYTIDTFPNQITWTKEKQSGADIDLWTNITLASTYDLNGAKGAITSLNTWKDKIYCFQDDGVSVILFNSRVQIPTSDGIPIEISNNYKVDGYKYLSEKIGCKNKWTITGTSSGLYFIDSKNNHLYHIGEGIQDVTTIHNMTSWFNNTADNEIIYTLYDDINHDLYLFTKEEVLCYSEILGQFISFMDYKGIRFLESNNGYVYTMRDRKLYWMFKGEYNNFFGTQKGWDFSFISNGVDNNNMDFDKIFSTIDYRMDMFDENNYNPSDSLNYIQVSNEYQDTGEVSLLRLKTAHPLSYNHKDANLQKKFRIWRIQIPRNKNSLDRIRNPWCKIKLGNNGNNNLKAVLHDLNVQYFV